MFKNPLAAFGLVLAVGGFAVAILSNAADPAALVAGVGGVVLLVLGGKKV